MKSANPMNSMKPAQSTPRRLFGAALLLGACLACALLAPGSTAAPGTALAAASAAAQMPAGEIRVANLIYGSNQTSVCFADTFLADVRRETPAAPARRLVSVRMDGDELFEHPFAVMTGEGVFRLSDPQRENLKAYLAHGGFLIASAGCSSKPWAESFRREMGATFPGATLTQLKADHPVFTQVNDCTRSERKHGSAGLPELFGLEMDGRLVLVFSPDGLNDSGNAGPNCCCCGGDELKSARLMNVNLLVYALTH